METKGGRKGTNWVRHQYTTKILCSVFVYGLLLGSFNNLASMESFAPATSEPFLFHDCGA